MLTLDAVRFNCLLLSQFGLKVSPIAGKVRQFHGCHLQGILACARQVMRESGVFNGKVEVSKTYQPTAGQVGNLVAVA